MARRVLGVPDARRDSVVGRSDLVHVVEPVDQIGEAPRVEDHVDGVDVALLVDLVRIEERMRVEVDEARWLPLDEAPRLLAYGGEREMARKALDRFAP